MQNTAARLVFNLRKYDRITPALVTRHWLPVKYRIEFKTLLIVFKGLHDQVPTYIQEMITPSKSKRYSIRSNEERVLKVPKFKHDTFGKRAFAVYGPLAWNWLPKEIRLCDEIEAFKRNLKTHLFVKFVNESTLAIWFDELLYSVLECYLHSLWRYIIPVNLNLNLNLPKWNFTNVLCHWMTSYGYVIMDSCIISFNLNWIMQSRQFYNIATEVSRQSATSFGDLPDWWMPYVVLC